MKERGHIIVEITQPHLDSAIRLVQKTANQACLYAIDVATLTLQTTEFIKSFDSVGEQSMMAQKLDQLMRLCRGRVLFDSRGLENPLKIAQCAINLGAEVVAVDIPLLRKYSPASFSNGGKIKVFGSFDTKAATDFDAYSSTVAADFARTSYCCQADGIICNNPCGAMAARKKVPDKKFTVASRLSMSDLGRPNLVRDATAKGTDLFIASKGIAEKGRIIDFLRKEIAIARRTIELDFKKKAVK